MRGQSIELGEIPNEKGSQKMDYQDIIYTKEAGVATITFNRPDNRNTISPEMTQNIHKALEDAAKDDEVRVLVITGAGRVFNTGGNVRAMVEQYDQQDEKWKDQLGNEIPLTTLVHRFEKPVIAAINGVAAASGLDLALACDIRIASDRARFAQVFIRRGRIPPSGGTYFLPRLVGIDKACLLIWTGDMIDAKEAERIGLVTMVVPHEDLESATRDLAEKLAKGPPLAIKNAKRALYGGMGIDLESALEHIDPLLRELRETEDYKEGARAFVEKRQPIFKGR